MTFDLTIPQPSGNPLNISISVGETLFALGANGTGKSNLMQRFYGSDPANARRISAHRQTWFHTNGITLPSDERRRTGTNIRNWDVQLESRWQMHS
jgi:ABC-type cobalamin/Fe3+-siderophores transport system ATPase subunit